MFKNTLTPVADTLRKFMRIAKLDNIKFEMNDSFFQDRLIVTGKRKEKQTQIQISLIDLDSVGEDQMLEYAASEMKVKIDRFRKPKENTLCPSS